MKRPFALASAARPFVLAGVASIAAAGAASAQTLTIGVRGGPDSIDPHFTATGTHAEALEAHLRHAGVVGRRSRARAAARRELEGDRSDHVGVQAAQAASSSTTARISRRRT